MLCKVEAKITKRIAAMALALFCALSLSLLSGCGGQQNDESVIKETLTADLDNIKNLDDAFIQDFSSDIDLDQLTAYGIDGIEFAKKYLDGFDYSIESITVDGDTAQAEVILTCKSFTGYQKALETAVTNLTEDPDALADADLNSKIGEIVIGSLDEVEPVQTEPITISYTKVDGTWTPASDAANAISSALMTN